jgi:hypothetical protein
MQVAQRAAANVNLPSMNAVNCLGSLGGTTEFLTGSLDDVRLWNTVRTAQQIADNKDAELAGNESGLVAYYKMSNGNGTTLADNASGSYPGTLVSGVSWISDTPIGSSSTSATYDFNITSDLATYFNPDASQVFTNVSYGGLGNTGSVSIQASTADIWTLKTGVSHPSTGNTITVSAYFYNVGGGGYGNIGFATSNQNETDSYGSPPYGLGMDFHGGGGDFVSNRAQTTASWAPNGLASNNWYNMILQVTPTAANTYTLYFRIYNSDASGNLGTLNTQNTLTGINNTPFGAATALYPYFSATQDRMRNVDNFYFSAPAFVLFQNQLYG